VSKKYASTPSGVMDCLTDAVSRVANMPVSDERKVALTEMLIGEVAARLTIEDLHQIAEDGLKECKRRLEASGDV